MVRLSLPVPGFAVVFCAFTEAHQKLHQKGADKSKRVFVVFMDNVRRDAPVMRFAFKGFALRILKQILAFERVYFNFGLNAVHLRLLQLQISN